LMLRGSWP